MTSAADLHDSTSYRQPEYLFMAMFEEACAPDSAASRWARQTELVIDDSQEDAGPLLDLIVHPEEESMCGPVCEMLLRACNHVVEEVLDDPELGTKLWSSSSYALRAQLSAMTRALCIDVCPDPPLSLSQRAKVDDLIAADPWSPLDPHMAATIDSLHHLDL
ncbi:uncharacterized protein AMSG_01488 [Thecamonas trahens ATCC 50062]|uniref:Uncharacterized protein n=1 Tax=Thecamonas trahens ATCC 50062 TaxID=461836 RepID=A0A0L0DQR6_THETB|nr:hypothetical protein AMSG_01488 [Thecamonas trahens ATCC 50062]KNC54634.1 hypothetical protein AMSG_01488 [Thecamonas trahens ATCC 50062]|eukprot:XP_013761541.1 hypothetical protein AMSG_01488 [Thecamonas trahens ATCC 50062]